MKQDLILNERKMRWFLIHIAIKDLSFLLFYFVIMKYNLTNETFLPETMSSFPAAPTMSLGNIISATLFYNIIPIITSLILYYPIVYLTNKLFKSKRVLRLIFTAISLTSTTPILYYLFIDWSQNDHYIYNAEIIAWLLCFLVSIITYVKLNRNENLQRN